MTDLEKATFYIVGYVDGYLEGIDVSEKSFWAEESEDWLNLTTGERVKAEMLPRIRKQYPSLTDADIEAAYNAASMDTIAYIPAPAKRAAMDAEMRALYPENYKEGGPLADKPSQPEQSN